MRNRVLVVVTLLALAALAMTTPALADQPGPSPGIYAWYGNNKFDIYGREIADYCQFGNGVTWSNQDETDWSYCTDGLGPGKETGLAFDGHNYKYWSSIGLSPPDRGDWVCAKFVCIDKYNPPAMITRYLWRQVQ